MVQKSVLEYHLKHIDKQKEIYDLIIKSKNKSLLKFYIEQMCMGVCTETNAKILRDHLKSFESLVDATSEENIYSSLTVIGYNLIKHVTLLSFYNLLYAMNNENKGMPQQMYEYINNVQLCDITDYEHPYLNEWAEAYN